LSYANETGKKTLNKFGIEDEQIYYVIRDRITSPAKTNKYRDNETETDKVLTNLPAFVIIF